MRRVKKKGGFGRAFRITVTPIGRLLAKSAEHFLAAQAAKLDIVVAQLPWRRNPPLGWL
jgi:hypothetical protein